LWLFSLHNPPLTIFCQGDAHKPCTLSLCLFCLCPISSPWSLLHLPEEQAIYQRIYRCWLKAFLLCYQLPPYLIMAS
jgi:hypothetical protein